MEPAIDLLLCRSSSAREFNPSWRYAVTRKISLLVPLFNSSRYLDQLKRDIDHQTRPFDEVVMHDDGSTDDTIEKATELGISGHQGRPDETAVSRSKPIACGRIIQLRAFSRSRRSKFIPNSSSAC